MMESRGFVSYVDVEDLGIVESCPECPHPGINLPPDWENNPNKLV
jgi:hypothetical protein